MGTKRKILLAGMGLAAVAVLLCLFLAGQDGTEDERASARDPSLVHPPEGGAVLSQGATPGTLSRDSSAARGPGVPGRASASRTPAEEARIAALKASAEDRRAVARERRKLRDQERENERRARRQEREDLHAGVARPVRIQPEPLIPKLDLGPPIYGVPGYPDKPPEDDAENPNGEH